MAVIEPWNIAAGELRQSVSIQTVSVANTDTRGHPVKTWTDTATNVACKVETPTGRKLELARQMVPMATHVVTMRYRPIDIDEMRLTYFGVKQTVLTGAVNSTATTLTVGAATNLEIGAIIRVDSEQMTITNTNGTSLTVTRGSANSTAANHANGASVMQKRVFNIGYLEDVAERHVKIVLTCTEGEGALASAV